SWPWAPCWCRQRPSSSTGMCRQRALRHTISMSSAALQDERFDHPEGCHRGAANSRAPESLAYPRTAERKRGRRTARTTRELGLISPPAMFDAIREPGVHLLAAKMEVRLARMPHRPTADAVVEVEQAGLVGNLGARLGRNQAPRRRWGDRRLLVTRTLAEEAAGAHRDHPRLLRFAVRQGLARNLGARGRRGRGLFLFLGFDGRGGGLGRLCLRGGTRLGFFPLGSGRRLRFVRFDRRRTGLQTKAMRFSD